MMQKIIFVVAAYFTLPVLSSIDDESPEYQAADLNSRDQPIKHCGKYLYSRLSFYDDILVTELNNLKTYSATPVTFNDDELTMLRMPLTYNSEFTADNKIVTILQFNKKIEEIQCVNARIVQAILYQFKKTETISTDQDNVIRFSKLNRIYYELKRKLAKMLSVLYVAKTVADKWLWKLYFKVCGLVDGTSLDLDIPNSSYLVDDKETNDGISKRIDMCSEDIHQGITTDSSDPIEIILETLFEPLYGSNAVDVWLGYEFTLIDLYLLEMQELHDVFLNGKLGFILDKNEMKEKLDHEKTLMTHYVESRMWVQQPFPDNSYLEYIGQIMKLKLYWHSWLHIVGFANMRSMLTVSNEVIKNLNVNFACQLERASELVFFKDDIFINELIVFLYIELRVAPVSKIVNEVKRIMEKAKSTLNELGVTVSKPPVHDTNTSYDVDFMENNALDLHDYFETLRKINGEFDFSFTSFFLGGNDVEEEPVL